MLTDLYTPARGLGTNTHPLPLIINPCWLGCSARFCYSGIFLCLSSACMLTCGVIGLVHVAHSGGGGSGSTGVVICRVGLVVGHLVCVTAAVTAAVTAVVTAAVTAVSVGLVVRVVASKGVCCSRECARDSMDGDPVKQTSVQGASNPSS